MAAAAAPVVVAPLLLGGDTKILIIGACPADRLRLYQPIHPNDKNTGFRYTAFQAQAENIVYWGKGCNSAEEWEAVEQKKPYDVIYCYSETNSLTFDSTQVTFNNSTDLLQENGLVVFGNLNEHPLAFSVKKKMAERQHVPFFQEFEDVTNKYQSSVAFLATQDVPEAFKPIYKTNVVSYLRYYRYQRVYQKKGAVVVPAAGVGTVVSPTSSSSDHPDLDDDIVNDLFSDSTRNPFNKQRLMVILSLLHDMNKLPTNPCVNLYNNFITPVTTLVLGQHFNIGLLDKLLNINKLDVKEALGVQRSVLYQLLKT